MIPKDILKHIKQLEIRSGKLVNEIFAGQYSSVFKGRGMEFAKCGEYMPGDDVRTIDWNVTARYGRPFIKKFTEERELTVILLVDASSSQSFGPGISLNASSRRKSPRSSRSPRSVTTTVSAW